MSEIQHLPLKPIQADFQTYAYLDTSTPNMARIFDYLAGGSAHFEADRQAAHNMTEIFPPLRKWVQLRRAFMFEAVQRLYEAGFRDFLDLGTGMPRDDSIHAVTPHGRVIYSDLNPIAVAYGTSLFKDMPHVDYVLGNAADVETLLHEESVQRLLGQNPKVAIGLNNVPLFLSEADMRHLAQTLYVWGASGSVIYLPFQPTDENSSPAKVQIYTETLARIRIPTWFKPLSWLLDVFKPWQLDFIEPLTQFLGLPDSFLDSADGLDAGIAYTGLFLIKR